MSEQLKTVTLELKPTLVASRTARAAVERLLVENEERVDFVADALLLTSELVNNAVLHARDELRFSAEFDPSVSSLRVEVADRSSAIPVLVEDAGDAPGGHGLRLVATIARKWGVASNDVGKVVWFELGG
jgi:anti-sigma regulatory factor (Ser/Thr protein kinase)